MQRSARWNVANPPTEDGPATGTQSLERALALLDLLALMTRERLDGVSLSDLARVSRRPKPSVHRMLSALVRAGYAERVGNEARYRLGLQSRILGEIAGRQDDPLIDASADSLIRLATVTEDSCFLTIRRGSFGVCALREEGTGLIRNNALAVGDRHPLGVGGGSLAILAALPDADVEQVLAANAPILVRGYPSLTPDVLRELVERTRTHGYALNDGRAAPGSWAVGLPILDAAGEPVAALSVASIEQRLTGEHGREVLQALQAEIDLIHDRTPGLGGTGRTDMTSTHGGSTHARRSTSASGRTP